MNIDDFTFDLPDELIASHPAEKRDASRLMVVPRDPARPIEHRQFPDIREYLRPGDVLVMNNSRVIPARLFGRRRGGGLSEVLLLHPEPANGPRAWRALVRPGKKTRAGLRLEVDGDRFSILIDAEHEAGERTVILEGDGSPRELIERYGHMPLPPYILKRRAEERADALPPELHRPEDRERYQTVYAETEGSVAAPTAGLHFTPELLEELRAMGVETRFVTLHVGAGTFQVVEPGADVSTHKMHFEEYEISPETAEAVNRAKSEARRIVAVGTTSVRTLEAAAAAGGGSVISGSASTDLMIAPGYQFHVVNALITNFHLPRSTLLLLVSAHTGRDRILQAYREAVEQRYRFFSYGDGMFLLGNGE